MNTEETIKNQESISDDNQDTDVKNTQKETENSDIQGGQESDSPSDSESSEDVKEDDNPEVCEEESEKLRSELDEYKDKYLRLMAEFDNYRKRVLKEKSELILNGGEKVISSILPVLDDIERAEESMTTIEDSKSFQEGVSLIFEKLKTILEKNGLKKMDTVGEQFNVDFHEAIAMVPGQPDELRGKVIDSVQTGYLLNDKVLRHAKVAVAE
ncbi:MAG: nucleotide exchange factor GrpE [Bacteroidaceae bacterium]